MPYSTKEASQYIVDRTEFLWEDDCPLPSRARPDAVPPSTIGFNAETIVRQGLEMTLWDVGYREGMWRLWKIYFSSASALLFVVDAADTSNFTAVKEALDHLLEQKDLTRVPLLIFANKQDLPGAVHPDILAQALSLYSIRGRIWHILGSSAVSAEGLEEGLSWICRVLKGN